MQFDPAPLRAGFDWSFLPAIYFLPDAPPPPEPLPDEIRDAIGRIHPSLMGGLHLSDFLPGEVEIVRVQIESVTADVLSVCARSRGKRIAYRVVDEYGTEFPVRPATSAKTLDLAQITRLTEDADPEPERGWGIALGAVKSNVNDGGSDPGDLRTFVTVTSAFYPELGSWYDRLINAWVDAVVAERHGDRAEERSAHEHAR